MLTLTTTGQTALTAFSEQRAQLDSIADKNVHDPAFIRWNASCNRCVIT